MAGALPPYIISFVLFFIVSILVAFVDNFAGLMVLCFLQGLVGSPCLASGGASIHDVYSWSQVPNGFIFWVTVMYSGPEIAPLLSGYARRKNIKRTENFRASSETRKIKVLDIFVDAMIKPTEIAIKDPAAAVTCSYSALVYVI
ncbi:hypothetical protein N431DRAFT_452557 [Stipitochalara longipes BDJ]|nr:hypothetical protein N431DRAFT_452557 [Stipitochalara longipes BDJ]